MPPHCESPLGQRLPAWPGARSPSQRAAVGVTAPPGRSRSSRRAIGMGAAVPPAVVEPRVRLKFPLAGRAAFVEDVLEAMATSKKFPSEGAPPSVGARSVRVLMVLLAGKL